MERGLKLNHNKMKKYCEVYVANGQLEAEMIRLFLKANDIEAFIFQEGLGSTYGLTIGPLGEAKVVVPIEQKDQALRLLERMEQGEFDNPSSISDYL